MNADGGTTPSKPPAPVTLPDPSDDKAYVECRKRAAAEARHLKLLILAPIFGATK